MAISKARAMNTRPRVLLCFALILMSYGWPMMSPPAADAARNEFQEILQECVACLWTGRQFTPQLEQRQKTLKTMLETSAVSKAELETMLEKSFLPLLNHQETSRYILKTFPERANALFSPHLEWDKVKEIMWRAMASAVTLDEPFLLTIGTLAPPGTPWLNVPETMLLPEIKRLSLGKIAIKIYGGGVMGEDTDIMEKMAAGQIDGCGCTALGVLKISPEMSTLLLPGLFNNYTEVDYIIEKFRKRLDLAFEKKGYILAGILDTGNFYLFSRNKISGLADLRKQKTLTWFGSIETAMYQELGVDHPLPVAVPDIVSSFATAAGDTVLAPAAWMLGMQAYQYASFYIKPPLLYSPTAVIVSTKTIDRVKKQAGISETFKQNIQEVLVFEIVSLEQEWNRQVREYEKKSLKAFESKCGMKVITFSPEDQEVLKKAGNAVQKRLAGRAFPEDLINDIQNALAEYRAKN